MGLCLVLALAAGPLTSFPAAAQSCFQSLGTLVNSSDKCDAIPDAERSVGLKTLSWKGHQYLLSNSLNNLELYRIDDPQAPVHLSDSRFGVPLDTDADQNLRQFSVCDNCRYGVAGFGVEGLVLFDLGTAVTPSFAAKEVIYRYPLTNPGVEGGFTYSVNGQEYLIASYLGSDCGNTGSAVYAINGLLPANRSFEACVQGSKGGIHVASGWHVPTADGPGYLYLTDYDNYTHIFKIAPANPAYLTYVSTPFYGLSEYGTSVDVTNHKVATASRLGVKLYSIDNPAAPQLLTTFDADTDPLLFMSVAALRYPLLVVSKRADKVTHAFDMSDPANPQELDPSFWDTANSWNAYPCSGARALAIAPDLSALYYARYSVLENFGSDSCIPRADVSATPQPAFPGDTVTVRNTSTAPWDTSALWVTDSSGTVLAGSATQTAGQPAEEPFTVPLDLAGSPYTAHVAITGALGTFSEDRPVVVDSTPQARLVATPSVAVVGDEVTLDASSSEGHPVSYSWAVTRDGAPASPAAGSCTPPADQSLRCWVLGAPGTWCFTVTAAYAHPTLRSSNYTSTASFCYVQVSSVAADFLTSADPGLYDTSPIVLDAGDDGDGQPAGTARWSPGADVHFQWSVVDDGTGVPPAAFAGCGDQPVCTIWDAAGGTSLPAGSYTATLTLSNGSDTSIRERTLTVLASTVNFTFIPQSPGIGDEVVFTVTGVDTGGTGTYGPVSWSFGAAGCGGASATTGCDPATQDCTTAWHAYAAAGAWQVTLTLHDALGDHQVTHTVPVAPAGVCGGDCPYTLQPAAAWHGDLGGDGSFVLVSHFGCPWSLGTPDDWITLNGDLAGSGTALVPYAVYRNLGLARTGAITGGSATFQVNQQVGQPALGHLPATPRIGEAVTFTLNTPVVSSVSWDLGGAGCSGSAAIFTCSSSQPDACASTTFHYASAGTKQVTALVTADGFTFPLVTDVVVVGPDGTCPTLNALFEDGFDAAGVSPWDAAVGVSP